MKKLALALLFVAFFARLVAAFYWDARVARLAESTKFAQTANSTVPAPPQDGPFFFGDSDSYWKLGRALAFGRPYRFDAERNWEIFRTPGYPAILAPLFWAFGDNPPIFAARLVGVAFGTLNVALVGVLAFSVFRRRDVAALSALFAALDPTLVFQSVLVLSEEPFLTFALIQAILAIKTARTLGFLPDATADFPENAAPAPSPFRAETAPATQFRQFAFLAATLGATSAAAVYLRPSWYHFLTFATIFVLAFVFWNAIRRQNRPPRRAFAAFAVVAVVSTAVFFAALSPWIARNYRVAHRFIPTSLQMGASLYDGLSPTATGASDMRFVDDFRRLEAENPSGPADVHFEVRLDERLKTAALDWTRANPNAAARLALVKFARLWSPIPREPAFSATPLKILLVASFTPLLLGGLCGFFLSLRRRGTAWTLLIPAFYVSALHVIFVSSIRYRIPVLPGFAILTAFFLIATLPKIGRKQND